MINLIPFLKRKPVVPVIRLAGKIGTGRNALNDAGLEPLLEKAFKSKPAAVALVIFGIPAARVQHRHSPIIRHAHEHTHVDIPRVGIVVLILAAAVTMNVVVNIHFTALADSFPFLGVAVWAAILLTVGIRRPDWEVLPETFMGTVFLLSLVSCASMMPVEELPAASWQSALTTSTSELA